ncbi:MAG: 3-carboxy-cis,cis-muconate cycloisomerase [Actinobacteria bacterium]|nr:3-carboxy-cis,cis-muconate cycloisomerase [Actinomycetota bacterium]
MDDLLSFPAQVQRWLDVEAALARACAAAGLVEAAQAEAVARACHVDLIDLHALDEAAATAATPVIPLLRQLTAAVPREARAAVHFGATSQDILDTALVLFLRDGLRVLVEELLGAGDRCAELAQDHRGTVMAGRTLLQPAVPVTFGLKAARWLAALARQLERLYGLGFHVQLGGAAGTLAAYGERGLEVTMRLAEELDLDVPALPWHAERDLLQEIAATLALVAGTCATMGHELVLLAQAEVGEVTDAGAGGSSAMPHKRNPVDATFAVAAGRSAAAAAAAVLTGDLHEHERSAGAWQAEWATVPRLVESTVVAAARARRALEGCRVDGARMRANLEEAGDQLAAEPLAVALVADLGREEAHALVAELAARAAATGAGLLDLAGETPAVSAVLTGEQLERLRDPRAHLGVTDALIDRALDRWHRVAVG